MEGPLLPSPSRSGAVADAVLQLHARLDELQFGQRLEDARFLVVDQEPFGFGAQLHRRVLGLQLGVMFSRTVVFVRDHDPPYAPCFEPTGTFVHADLVGLPHEPFTFSEDQPARVAVFDFARFWADRNKPSTSAVYDWVPPAFAGLGLNRFFFEGQLLERFRYLPYYASSLEEARRRIGFARPIIGVHIRRGDKSGETPYVPLRKVNAEIVRAVEDSGINRVFVTSDDPTVFGKLPRRDRIEYVYDRDEPRYNNANHRFLRSRPELAQEETLTALKVFELLSDSSLVIGQHNAHLTLLAIARNAARTGNLDNHRLLRGDYAMRFSTAEPRDWGAVCAYRWRKLKGALLLAPVRHALGSVRRVLGGRRSP